MKQSTWCSCLSCCACSTHQATWRQWLTKQRRRPAPDRVVVDGLSIILVGGGHGDNARSRRKRRMARKRRRSSWWPAWMKRSHRVMESRRQPEIVVGAFTVAQSRSGKVFVRRGQVRTVWAAKLLFKIACKYLISTSLIFLRHAPLSLSFILQE